MRANDADVPEAQWIREAQEGDAVSFGRLFDRYYTMIHSFAYRVCLSESDADDLAQEAFIRAARGLSAYQGNASFKNWLYRIAHHVIVDWQRRTSRQRTGNEAFTGELDIRSQERPADYHDVHAALQQLPTDLREAVALVFFEEMNHRQAADILSCAEPTISWRIFRAKRLLKKQLQKSQSEASLYGR